MTESYIQNLFAERIGGDEVEVVFLDAGLSSAIRRKWRLSFSN